MPTQPWTTLDCQNGQPSPQPASPGPAIPCEGSWVHPKGVSTTACKEGTLMHPGTTSHVAPEMGQERQLATHQVQSKHVIFSSSHSTK